MMKIKIESTVLGAIVASILTINGCATNNVVDEPTDITPATVDLSIYQDQYAACPKVTTEAVLDCDAQDGTMRKEGMMGCYMCVVTYSDAGKTCQDASDCAGRCTITGQFLEYGLTNQYGQCEANNSPFGCYQTIENGVAGNALCVD